MQNSSNPVFSDKAVKSAQKEMSSAGVMTMSGTLIKTLFLFTIFTTGALLSWAALEQNADYAWGMIIGASVVSLVVALIIIFKAPGAFLSIIYSGAQGVAVGAISYYYADWNDGIITQAILLTAGITLGMYLAYSTGFVKVTEKLRSIIIIGTFGVLIYYLITFVLSLFGVNMTSLFTGTTGIIIAAIIVVIAALNYLLDFDFIEKSVKAKAPKQFEWYGAFGLMVTFIWLYLSILRLLGASNR